MYESNDPAVNTVTSTYITTGKDMTLQQQIRSTFVTVLWFRKTEIHWDIGPCESLESYNFQNLLTILT